MKRLSGSKRIPMPNLRVVAEPVPLDKLREISNEVTPLPPDEDGGESLGLTAVGLVAFIAIVVAASFVSWVIAPVTP